MAHLPESKPVPASLAHGALGDAALAIEAAGTLADLVVAYQNPQPDAIDVKQAREDLEELAPSARKALEFVFLDNVEQAPDTAIKQSERLLTAV